jgi:hypothetical protein
MAEHNDGGRGRNGNSSSPNQQNEHKIIGGGNSSADNGATSHKIQELTPAPPMSG